MTFARFVNHARNKNNFVSVKDYIDFASKMISAKKVFIQAEIVCQNEANYRFWQLPVETGYAISRPLNNSLLCDERELRRFVREVLGNLHRRAFMEAMQPEARALLGRVIYTVQQMIGVALDGLPSNESNFARKLNGDLFERLIQLWISQMGVSCSSACIRVPVLVDGVKQCDMNFQHDLVIRSEDEVKIIGSVKTSSKDRIGKIFVDKMLLRALTGEAVPHIAVFLNDVQRGKKVDRSYRVSSTFTRPLQGIFHQAESAGWGLLL